MDFLGIFKRSSRPGRAALAGLCALAASACVPDTDVDESTITAPRVLAIRAEPAEAREGERVTYSALFVDAQGPREDGTLVWFQCSARLPLSELAPISKTCLDPNSAENTKFGAGPSASAAIPANACALFGPNPPAAKEGEDPGRPVDADATGGYKLPILLGVRADVDENLVVYEERLSCNLSGATPALSAEFRSRYRVNTNPDITSITLVRADGTRDTVPAGERALLGRGESVSIGAAVPRCPEEDVCGDGVCGIDESRADCAADCTTLVGCAGAERYLRYDAGTRALVSVRESLRFAWYGTGGKLAKERTGLAADASGRTSSNDYTAPSAPGDYDLFVVVRDARGGVGHRTLSLHVD